MSDSSKKFAEGICFYKLFWFFILFSIFGSLYEKVQYFIVHYFRDGSILWPSRTAVIYGQFNMIYGFGAVLFLIFLNSNKNNNLLIFLKASFIGGFFEYIISFLLEVFIGTSSWNYSDKFLNINGRTAVPIMIFWGLLGFILVKVIYPFLSRIIEQVPYKFGCLVSIFLLIFLAFDMTISWTALLRQNLRRKGVGPFTLVGEFYDKIYTDDYLKKVYPNMVSK